MLTAALKILRLTPALALVRRRALRRGLWEGRPGWRAVAVVWLGASALRRLMGPRNVTLTSEKLRPGQTVVVSARRGRRVR